MYAYFGSMPVIQNSWTCCSEFGRMYENKTGQKYSKADGQMYGKLCKFGNEENAIRIAEKKLEQCIREGKTKPSEMCPCTTAMLILASAKLQKKAIYHCISPSIPCRISRPTDAVDGVNR